MITGMSYETDDSEGDMMAVEGSDGQQYVVLEVIEVADDGEEGTSGLGSGIHPESFLEASDMDGSFLLPESKYNLKVIQFNKDEVYFPLIFY